MLHRAWCGWTIFACVIGAIVAASPDFRTVTPNYREACLNWFAGQPLYAEGVHGFLYFPHAAILFAPFAYLPTAAGEVLWRLVSIGSLALAVWRFSRLAIRNPKSKIQNRSAHAAASVFALMTCLAIPPAIASARNGQMNLMLAGLAALAFAELAGQRWRMAAFWLCLGAAFKPLMIVPMGVAAAAYAPVRRPMICGCVCLLIAPFFTQHPDYVCRQYEICVRKLFLAGNPGVENPASDLFGLLLSLGYAAPVALQTATRVAAGLVTVVLAVLAVRRQSSSVGAPAALALTACYLALFNPRMENNGFVILSPTLGLIAVDGLLKRRRLLPIAMMVVASLGIAGSFEITRGHNFWLCPLLTLSVWYYAVREALISLNASGA